MTKHTVHSIAREIVAREGGYVNDPDDPGGPTKYGVTIHTMRRLGMDLDKDGDVDVQDVKILTIDQAVDIFIKHYFYGPRINELPEILHDTVFDMQVNAGAHAVKILQRMCNEIGGTGTRIVVDGFIGPRTLEKVRATHRRMGDSIRDAYGVERRNYYFALADRKPSSRKYARDIKGRKGGWIRRAEEFISPRYHMTHAEFQRRTRGWG